MDPLTIAAIGTQALEGIGQEISGIFQKGKAKRMAQSNIRPLYKINQPIKDNQALIESRASQGLSDASKSLYTQESDRGITSSIDAIEKGGGTVDNIADLYTARNTGISKMALIDDSMRVQNMRNLVEQNRQYSDEQDKEFQFNQYGPYADKAQAAAAISKQGTDNIWKGFNTIGSAVANAAIANKYEKEGGSVFGNGGAPPPVISSSATSNTSQTIADRYPGLRMGNGNYLDYWQGGVHYNKDGTPYE